MHNTHFYAAFILLCEVKQLLELFWL